MNQWKFKCTDIIKDNTNYTVKLSYIGTEGGLFSLTSDAVVTLVTQKHDLFIVGQEYQLDVKNIGAARAVA